MLPFNNQLTLYLFGGTMLVYRLELKKKDDQTVGGGIYRESVSYDDYDCIGNYLTRCGDIKKHPLPKDDPLLSQTWHRLEEQEINTDYVFCFKNYDQLKNWFYLYPDRLQKVKEANIVHVGIYQVDDEYYHKGQFQSIAHKGYMTLVDSWEIGFEP